jgi:hypothetical protein
LELGENMNLGKVIIWGAVVLASRVTVAQIRNEVAESTSHESSGSPQAAPRSGATKCSRLKPGINEINTCDNGFISGGVASLGDAIAANGNLSIMRYDTTEYVGYEGHSTGKILNLKNFLNGDTHACPSWRPFSGFELEEAMGYEAVSLPDGTIVAFGGYQNFRLRNSVNIGKVHFLSPNGKETVSKSVTSGELAVTPDGKVVLASNGGQINFFDPKTGQVQKQIDLDIGHDGYFLGKPSFLANGTLVAAYRLSKEFISSTVFIMIDKEGQILRKTPMSNITSPTVLPDGKTIAIPPFEEGPMRIVDSNGTLQSTSSNIHSGGRNHSPAILKDGTLVVSDDEWSSDSNTVTFLNKDGSIRNKYVIPEDYHDRSFTLSPAAAMPDGSAVIVTNQGHVYSFDSAGRKTWDFKLSDGKDTQVSVRTKNAPGVGADGAFAVAYDVLKDGLLINKFKISLLKYNSSKEGSDCR